MSKREEKERARLQGLKEEALRIVNVVRRAFGMMELNQLPPGITRDANSCVLAEALPAGPSVMGSRIAFQSKETATRVANALKAEGIRASTDGWEEVNVPQTLGEFVAAFDSHKYPELEKGE